MIEIKKKSFQVINSQKEMSAFLDITFFKIIFGKYLLKKRFYKERQGLGLNIVFTFKSEAQRIIFRFSCKKIKFFKQQNLQATFELKIKI
ncbi:hypothetical protein BpHYR1_045577 [Brachionus plicatilis]|uniref:Uncharacterized protein n=1 Tax=Brachionus plicatilis TaxID=10195 RepID=A0A3M7QN45_BRAPC|nr:hypothetical protein BpHYR1_045577 [Brachionus plicatilis]